MTKSELMFLDEVAAELVSRGIAEPTIEQIADAMQYRLKRQQEILNQYFSDPKFREVVTHGLAIEIYHDARKRADREQWIRSMAESDQLAYLRDAAASLTDKYTNID